MTPHHQVVCRTTTTTTRNIGNGNNVVLVLFFISFIIAVINYNLNLLNYYYQYEINFDHVNESLFWNPTKQQNKQTTTTTTTINTAATTTTTTTNNNVIPIIPNDIDRNSSEYMLLQAAIKQRVVFDDEINMEYETQRCQRYGLTLNMNNNNNNNNDGNVVPRSRRRIFWGTLIADDTWHTIATTAMESYGIFHTAVFIESNRTQTFSKRQLKYYYYNNSSDNNNNDSNSDEKEEDEEETVKMNFKLLQSKNLWGPNTNVIIEQYINEDNNSTVLKDGREHTQRNEIIQQWKKSGMTTNDIGYISDVDEFFSRDFLRAMQLCHVPQFDNVFETIETETNVEIIESNDESSNESSKESGSENNSESNRKKVKNCRDKKVFSTSNIQLEGSPLCIPKSKIGRHIHPDMVIGHCIDGIGNNNGNDSNKDLSLFTASKFRKRYDSDPNGIGYGTYQHPVGFHYHNTFTSTAVLRNKYLTYGHPQRHALHQPLRTIDNDLKFMIHCVLSTDLERKNKNKNKSKNKNKTMTMTKQQQQQQQQQTTKTTQTYLEDGIYNEMFQAANVNDNKNDNKNKNNNNRSSSLSSVSVSKIPIAFIAVPLYVKKRHEELTTIIKQDIKDHPYANKKKKKVESTVER